jgi:hypothetical protein
VTRIYYQIQLRLSIGKIKYYKDFLKGEFIMFFDVYLELCNERGLRPSSKKTVNGIGISDAMVTLWKNGSAPSVESLKKVAAYFNVTTDYLLLPRRFR